MISIPEAQRIVLQHTQVTQPREVGLQDALGRVLAHDVHAQEPLPPFPASIKDGYAVNSSDGPGDYTVAFEVHAGCPGGGLQPGTVAYIGTGGPVPEGADAVVQIENTEQLPPGQDGKRRVRIVKGPTRPGEDIRATGSDIKPGELVLAAGALIAPAEVGLLATVGAARVQVHRQVQVAVMSTGDEVVEPATQKLGPGQIRDANRSMLLAAASQAGAQVTDLGIISDDEAGLERALQKAVDGEVDILMTSGGVSMGHKDLVKPLLQRRGQVHFGKVLMKPGKPLTFATLPAACRHPLLVFGLPGNPVSSIVTFNLVVLPAIRKLAGWQQPQLRRVHARTTRELKLDPERPEYHRVTLSFRKAHYEDDGQHEARGELVAESTGGQISSRLLSMRSANALVELPKASGALPAGSTVSALLIADLAGMPDSEQLGITSLPSGQWGW
eukprot:jgi/Astpho2/8529/e_gw1.00125.32.1_t